MSEIVLGADVGGTKSLLSLAEVQKGIPRVLCTARYLNDDFIDFYALLRQFLVEWASGVAIARACFGVAGPHESDTVVLTNRLWTISCPAVSALLNGASVALVNDFEAAAYGIELLGQDEKITLQNGNPVARAPQVVIGAGTGLGIAYRIWNGTHYRVVPGEGGHMGFAPADETQMRIWHHVHAAEGRVSSEMLVSGGGLARIYAALGGETILPAEVTQRAAAQELRAREAVEIFARCYGAVAGDHALAIMARGGVFLAGGIAPRIHTTLQASGLLHAFNSKGQHSLVVQRMPLHLVLNAELGLLGAVLNAARG